MRAMLHEGFEWKDRYQYARGELALVHGGKHVAMLLMRRADGGWLARPWCHWPIEAPIVSRQCSSFETEKSGIEKWAERHQVRTNAEVTGERALA